MLKVLRGFRDFILRGNVIELAVAVAIGTAFTAVVKQFGDSFITPLVSLANGNKGVKAGSFEVHKQLFTWAAFVNSVIYFVITAAIIYFVIVVPVNAFNELRKRGETPPETPPTTEELLTQIRDLLRAQRDRAS